MSGHAKAVATLIDSALDEYVAKREQESFQRGVERGRLDAQVDARRRLAKYGVDVALETTLTTAREVREVAFNNNDNRSYNIVNDLVRAIESVQYLDNRSYNIVNDLVRAIESVQYLCAAGVISWDSKRNSGEGV